LKYLSELTFFTIYRLTLHKNCHSISHSRLSLSSKTDNYVYIKDLSLHLNRQDYDLGREQIICTVTSLSFTIWTYKIS